MIADMFKQSFNCFEVILLGIHIEPADPNLLSDSVVLDGNVIESEI